MMSELLYKAGDRVRVLSELRQRASAFGIKADEIVEVIDAERLPGDGPAGRLKFRLPSGAASDWIEAGNFELAADS